jgi:hypothetical protein
LTADSGHAGLTEEWYQGGEPVWRYHAVIIDEGQEIVTSGGGATVAGACGSLAPDVAQTVQSHPTTGEDWSEASEHSRRLIARSIIGHDDFQCL